LVAAFGDELLEFWRSGKYKFMTIKWPGGRPFAFTVFDDPDAQTLGGVRTIYDFLADAGLRTTVGVWPCGPTRERNSGGETCADAEYRRYIQELGRGGFEVGYHNTTPHACFRKEIADGLDAFADFFGNGPITMANHYNAEAIYWGRDRLSGARQALYRAATLGLKKDLFYGHIKSSPHFWGDLCEKRIRFCRNFTYEDVDTLRACPWMPYHDPDRHYVNYWFASSDGANRDRFLRLLSEKNQDTLEAGGGACIVYTHFGHGFVQNGVLDVRFRLLIDRLKRKNGWFVPVSTLLNYLVLQRTESTITAQQRRDMEWRWLGRKLLRGTS
jgi:hypothetical protein